MSLAERFESLDRDGPKAWMELYQQLWEDTRSLVEKNKLTKKFAQSRANQDKNRYTNVLPYDQNRVKLLGDNDYINASFVSVPKANRNYILSQGPVEESVSDFWQMIFENNVPAIVMLNRLFEGGSMKCEKYFSCQQNPTMCFEPYTVHLESENTLKNFVSRKFLVKHNETEEERQVYQVQYTEWPDFGVPESTAHFLEMLEYIKTLNVLSTDLDEASVVVHCSAGIGRSGTFVLVDSVLRMTELGVAETEIDPNRLLTELRCQRSGLIQTPEQLQFAWKAIVDGLDKFREASGDAPILSSTSHDLVKKRKSETQEDIDERLAKRREMISNMVRKSHKAEEAASVALRKHRNPPSLFNNRSVIVGGVVAVASIFAYYYFRS